MLKLANKYWKMASTMKEMSIKYNDEKWKALMEACNIIRGKKTIVVLEYWIEKQ